MSLDDRAVNGWLIFIGRLLVVGLALTILKPYHPTEVTIVSVMIVLAMSMKLEN